MEQEKLRQGGCLCGAVRYTVKGAMRDVVACHCTQCRKQSGHYYAATDTNCSNLEVMGQDNITHYKASNEATRSFCKTCGSALFWQLDGNERISILAGTLDAPSDLKLIHHIFCEDKGDYYDINDGLTQFPYYS